MGFELFENAEKLAKIKVIGVGGGGSNAVNTMIGYNLTGVDFIAANTDAQALRASLSPIKIQLGSEITKGLGAGSDPSVGEKAAQESDEMIRGTLNAQTSRYHAGWEAAPVQRGHDHCLFARSPGRDRGGCDQTFSSRGKKATGRPIAGDEDLRRLSLP